MSSAEFTLVKVLGLLVVPPGANFVVALLALALLPFARRLAVIVLFVAAGSLYVFSTGVAAGALARSLYEYPARSPEIDPSSAGAIVVLGGGGRLLDHDGVLTVGGSTLVRLRHAVSLHRRTGLPLLVTGGSPAPGNPPEAELMVRSLENDFRVGARFVESRSINTAENAAYSAVLLAEAGITRIVLVTHATHMSRAVEVFRRQGLEVAPAPVLSRGGALRPGVTDFLPRGHALSVSSNVLHEYVGRLWYRVRYREPRAATARPLGRVSHAPRRPVGGDRRSAPRRHPPGVRSDSGAASGSTPSGAGEGRAEDAGPAARTARRNEAMGR